MEASVVRAIMDPEERQTLSIRVKGTCADGTEISSAKGVDPVLLKKYLECWCKLTDTDKTAKISLEEGSLIANFSLTAAACAAIVTDINLYQEGNCDLVATDRRIALTKMTSLTKKHNIELTVNTKDGEIYNAANVSDYKPSNLVVEEETEIIGKVTDAGGKSNPNIHILGKSSTYIVAASEKQLAVLQGNILYKEVCAHVRYKYNIQTRECSDYKLIDFVDMHSADKTEMQQIIDRESMLWKDVENPAEWLAAHRGEEDS